MLLSCAKLYDIRIVFFVENIENMATTFGQGGGGFIPYVRLTIAPQKSICESSLSEDFVGRFFKCINLSSIT